MVKLTVQRVAGGAFQVAITRDIIQSKEVNSKALAEGTVGYIGLSGFSDAAADEVVTALQAHLDAGRTRLILDLRGNPGGYVTAARKIASQFIASGPVFWEQDAKGNQVATDALNDGVATGADLRSWPSSTGEAPQPARSSRALSRTAVGRSSSAQQSFGKGTVQQWQELGGEGGAFKLTIARWLTPAQALDPQGRPDAGRRRHLPERAPGRQRPHPGQGGRGPRPARRPSVGLRVARLSNGPLLHSLAHRVRFPGTKGGDVQ